MLPNQGSNLDFTDPESVVLPITPLGTAFMAAKIRFFYMLRIKKRKIFSDFFRMGREKVRNYFFISSY